MDTRKLSIIHSHLIKPSAEPIEIPTSPNCRVLGITVDPVHHWPIVTVQEDADAPSTDTRNLVLHLRPDGTPFDEQHRYTHLGSVFSMVFAARLELVHVFQEMLPIREKVFKPVEEAATAPKFA